MKNTGQWEPMSSDTTNSWHIELKLYAILCPECFIGFIYNCHVKYATALRN